MNYPLKIIFLLIFLTQNSVKCVQYFSATAPALIRVDEPYKVAVTSHSSSYKEEMSFDIGINGKNLNGKYVNEYQSIKVNGSDSKIAKFNLTNLKPGHYYLNLNVKEVNFSKSVPLYYNPHKVTVLVQLDAIIYKTSDVIRFRIIATDSRTRPLKLSKENKISILDYNNNVLKAWKNVEFKFGVFESFFEYSDLAEGNYEILTEVDGTIISKTFEIHKEVFKAIKINLDIPRKVLYRDGFIKIIAHLKSFKRYQIFGDLYLFFEDKATKKLIHEKKIKINTNKIQTDVSFTHDLGIYDFANIRNFNVRASFIDGIYKREVSETVVFSVHLSDYNLVLDASYNICRIGKGCSLKIYVENTSKNNSSINGDIKVVVQTDKMEIIADANFKINSNSVFLETSVVSDDTNFLKILAVYDDIQYSTILYPRSLSDESISFHLLNSRPKLNELLEFQVITTNLHQENFVFQVKSQGILRLSKIIDFYDGKASFTILPNSSFSPAIQCVVFYVNVNGKIIKENLHVTFHEAFAKFDDVSIDNELIELKSTNYSISILGIPKTCEITNEHFFKIELEKYDFIPKHYIHFDENIPIWFYPYTYQKKFMDVNMHILTNAYQEIPCSEDFYGSSDFKKLMTFKNDNENEELNYDLKCDSNIEDKFFMETLFTKNHKNYQMESKELFLSTLDAITLSESHGIEMVNIPVDFKNTKPYNIEIFTSPNVKVDEISVIEVLIENLQSDRLKIMIEFPYTAKSEYKVLQSHRYNWLSNENGFYQKLNINPLENERLKIEIVSSVSNSAKIKIIGSSEFERKVTETKINFIHRGLLIEEHFTKLIDLNHCDGNKIFIFKCPKNSKINKLSVVESFMGLTLSNLDRIMKVSAGSAEQILLKFASNVLLLDFLVLTEQLTPHLKMKALLYLQSTYHRLLMYRLSDGSFILNIKNPQKSLWLTATVIKFLRNGRRYLSIEEEVFIEALDFIASQQKFDGAFEKEEKSSVDFTAYIASVLVEFCLLYPKYQSNVQKAVIFVENNCVESDIQSTAICTHFLFLTDSRYKNKFLKKFSLQSDYIYWQNVTSKEVLIAAYALLIYNQIPEYYGDAMKAFSWLISQSEKGEFRSIENTLVSLEAISKFASRSVKTVTDLVIVSEAEKFYVNNSTRLILQTFKSFNFEKIVNISGFGNAVFQLTCSNFINQKNEQIVASFKNSSCFHKLTLSLLVDIKFPSNFMIITLELPSGFAHDLVDASSCIMNEIFIQDENILKLYVNGSDFNSPMEISMLRKFMVYNQSSYFIDITDLNDRSFRATSFYELPNDLDLC